MQTDLKGKHFITTQEWTIDQLEAVFALAKELKAAKAAVPVSSPRGLVVTKTVLTSRLGSRCRRAFDSGSAVCAL